MQTKNFSPAYQLITFVGLLLTLVGTFAAIRVATNIALFDKYPTNGVLPVMSASLYQPQPYQQREEDCQVTQVYYSMDGMGTREPTETEKKMNQESEQRCLDSVAFGRRTAKVADISESAFFLFVGLGLLGLRPVFFKHAEA